MFIKHAFQELISKYLLREPANAMLVETSLMILHHLPTLPYPTHALKDKMSQQHHHQNFIFICLFSCLFQNVQGHSF